MVRTGLMDRKQFAVMQNDEGYFAAATEVVRSPLELMFLEATLTPLRLFTYLATPL